MPDKPNNDATALLKQPLTFLEHKNHTVADLETVAKSILDLAEQVREGNMDAFERMWIENGTEEGDAKIKQINEYLVLRYLFRAERVANTNESRKDTAGDPEKQS